MAGEAEAVVAVRVGDEDAVNLAGADAAALQLDLRPLAHVEEPVPVAHAQR